MSIEKDKLFLITALMAPIVVVLVFLAPSSKSRAEVGEANRNTLLKVASTMLEEKKFKQAAIAFEALALSGVRTAQHQISKLYASGNGVERDLSRAAAWSLISAIQDFAPAQYETALNLIKGRGFAQDKEGGIEWMKKAARQNYEPAKVCVKKSFIEC